VISRDIRAKLGLPFDPYEDHRLQAQSWELTVLPIEVPLLAHWTVARIIADDSGQPMPSLPIRIREGFRDQPRYYWSHAAYAEYGCFKKQRKRPNE